MMKPTYRKPLALVGYRAVGKSTISRWISRLSDWDLLAMDERIVEVAGRSISDWVAEEGWKPFRELESQLLDRSLNSETPLVIDTGGGVIEDPANREALRNRAFTVWIDCDPELIRNRLSRDAARPSLTGKSHADELMEVLERRRPWYDQSAHLRLDTTRIQPNEAAKKILELYRQDGDETQ